MSSFATGFVVALGETLLAVKTGSMGQGQQCPVGHLGMVHRAFDGKGSSGHGGEVILPRRNAVAYISAPSG